MESREYVLLLTYATPFSNVKLHGGGTGNRTGLAYNYRATSPTKYYAILLHR